MNIIAVLPEQTFAAETTVKLVGGAPAAVRKRILFIDSQQFALRQRDRIAPGRPMLFSCIALPPGVAGRLDNAAGFLEAPDIEATVRLVRGEQFA